MTKLQLIGIKFGYLQVLFQDVNKGTKTAWICICRCGNRTSVRGSELTAGKTVSCGCFGKEQTKYINKTHGLSKHPLYVTWGRMISRCYYKKNIGYKWYGGSGVTVCKSWRTNFKKFYDWALLNGYKKGLQLDRFPDKKGNYGPKNCRFATSKQNCRNKTNNVLLSIKGIKRTIAEWAEIKNMYPSTIQERLKLGWSSRDAICTPIRGIKSDGTRRRVINKYKPRKIKHE